MLGHASIAITLDLYSHVIPTMRRTAADAIDAMYAVQHAKLATPGQQ